MARVLVLDFDGTQLTLMAATAGRGGVKVDAVRTWPMEQWPAGTEAESIGRGFRERLQSFGIAPAPLVFGLPRDKVVLKEVKYPPVPEHDEPGVVRFQAMKELTDAEDSVIDYQPREATGGQRHALVVAVRKDFLRSLQLMAQGAGLKLQAVVPSAYGLIASLQGGLPAPDPAEAAAVLAVGPQSGEFLVARGPQLLFGRTVAGPALANEQALLGEVRRNLAVYSGQAGSQPVKSLYVSSDGGIAERLRQTLAVPVYELAGEAPAAAGLARLFASAEWPINFQKPREPKPPADPNRRKVGLLAALAAVVVVGLGLVAYMQVSGKDDMVQQLESQKRQLDAELVELDPLKRRAKAVDDWVGAKINWLDELYDLTARVKDHAHLRITHVTGDPIPVTGKSTYVARVTLKGLTGEDARPLQQLMADLYSESAYRVDPKVVGPNTLGIERGTFRQQFSTKYDLEKRPPSKYLLQFSAVAPERRRNRGIPDVSGLMNLLGGAP